MKKLFLGFMVLGAVMAFSTSAIASVATDNSFVQTQNADESKCGSGKCGGAEDNSTTKCGTGKCGGQ